jgi:hypothetical protein
MKLAEFLGLRETPPPPRRVTVISAVVFGVAIILGRSLFDGIGLAVGAGLAGFAIAVWRWKE